MFRDHASRQQKRHDASSCSAIGQSTYGFFHHRGYQSCKHDIQLAQNHIWNSLVSIAIVVGKYLWIHGGELTTWNCTAAGNVSTLPSMSITGKSLSDITQLDRQQHILYRSIFILD